MAPVCFWIRGQLIQTNILVGLWVVNKTAFSISGFGVATISFKLEHVNEKILRSNLNSERCIQAKTKATLKV